MEKEKILSFLNFRTFYHSFVPSLRKENGKGEAIGLCPFHDDHNPSLSVNLNKGLWNCLAGCGGGDLFDFYMRLKGTDFKTALREIAEIAGVESKKPEVIATYEYKDIDGKTLYNLPALNKVESAFVLEGEGKADLLSGWGLVATCLDSGANSPWRDDYLQALSQKEQIVILPDNDNAGRSYAFKIAKALHGKVGSIKVVELPGLQEREDIIDWAKVEGNDK